MCLITRVYDVAECSILRVCLCDIMIYMYVCTCVCVFGAMPQISYATTNKHVLILHDTVLGSKIFSKERALLQYLQRKSIVQYTISNFLSLAIVFDLWYNFVVSFIPKVFFLRSGIESTMNGF